MDDLATQTHSEQNLSAGSSAVQRLLEHRHWRYLWALLFGGLAALSFAPFELRPLLATGFAGLLLLWLNAKPAQAAKFGFVFGFGFFAVGVSWVRISVHEFGNVPLPFAWLAAMALAAYCALFTAAAGYIARKWFAGSAFPLFPAVVLWVLFDWLRGWLMTGFPWLSPGYALIETPFANIAPIGGVYAVQALALLALAAALQCAVYFFERRYWRPVGVSLVLFVAISLVAIGSRQNFTVAEGSPIKVAVIQGNVPQHKKWLPEEFLPTLQRYRQLSLEQQQVDLVLWPEVAIAGWYSQVESNFIRPLAAKLQQRDTALILGVLKAADEAGTEGRFYNALVQASATTAAGQFYFKRHLVPLGEYVPFEWADKTIKELLNIQLPNFAEGSRQQKPFVVAGHQIAATICYENAFGNEFRAQVAQGDWIANFSNDAWFGESVALPQNLEMARMRAAEAQKPLLRVTNTGISALISSRGEVLATTEIGEVAVLPAEISPHRGKTPYLKFGDWPTIALLLTFLLSFQIYRRLQRNPKRV